MSVQLTRRGKWRDSATTPTEWCNQHDLIPALTPLPHRTVDPWDVVAAVTEFLDSLPTTAATFQPNRVFKDSDARVEGRHRIVRAALLLVGSWPLGRVNDAMRWVNPDYPHERALAPGHWDDREDHVRECASIATLFNREIAPRFDLTPDSFRKFVSRANIPWGDLRSAAIGRMARTILTAAVWTDRSERQLAVVMPIPDGTVRSWLQERARNEGFTAPEEPEVSWFDD